MTILEHLKSARSSLVAARRALFDQLAKEKGRRRAAIVQQLHEVDRMLDSRFPYASQAAQDRVVDKYLGHKRDGVFVDVGGYDGLTGSNSLFFEHHRGWSGVLVEPVAAQCDLAKQRRKCTCLPYAVADSDGTADFIVVSQGYTQMSGLADQYDERLLKKVRSNPTHKEQTVSVETKTLAGILNEAGLTEIDFLSLDIEGGEVSVLKSFPFKDFNIRVWAIENNSRSNDINAIMTAQGYTLLEFCGPDEIYVLAN